MPPRKRTEGIDVSTDELLSSILDKSGRNVEMQPFFGNIVDSPADVKDFLSTGSSRLDLAISNRPHGGLPFGRISEISGKASSGKSLIISHMIANVQQQGGIAVLFETENSFGAEFATAVGVNVEKLIRYHNNRLEFILEETERIIEKVRKANKDVKVLIAIDSIANTKTAKDDESGYEKGGYNTDKSIILSNAMKKLTGLIGKHKICLVLTNQLRMKMNAQPFEDPYTTPGGMSIDFACSVRIRITKAIAIKNADKDEIGVKVNAKVTKTRFGPPNRKADFDVYYDRGIDDVSSWVKYLKDSGIISGSGHYTYVDSNGEEFKFTKSTWKQFTLDNPEVFTEIYNKMAESIIMRYNSENLSTLDGTASVDGSIAEEEYEGVTNEE